MKALTLRHPWPYAITRLGKDVENRTWRPHHLDVGELFAIHAGKLPNVESRSAVNLDYCYEIKDAVEWMDSIGVVVPSPFTLRMLRDSGSSAIVAVTQYGGIAEPGESKWLTGPNGWRLVDTFVLPEPVPCHGAQGLWTMSRDVEALVEEQMWVRK